MTRTILFVTTNEMWSGSEELWSRSLCYLAAQPHALFFSAPFEDLSLQQLPAQRLKHVPSFPPETLFHRILVKLNIVKRQSRKELLSAQLLSLRPDLVVISQGNNVASADVMCCCKTLGLPFVTLTQLVAEVHYLNLDKQSIAEFCELYISARKNFFVSRHNMELHSRMMGIQFSNAEVIFNPCKIRHEQPPAYPASQSVSIAMVGRLECLHKGYDLLVQIMALPKWKERAVQVNLYGDGPHLSLLESIVARERLNIVFKRHVADVTQIWKDNHCLLMTSRMEGQALSLIEAMWCQRFGILTDVGGASELVDDGINGFIAKAATVESIDDAMERAWALRDRWEDLGKKAAEALKRKHPENEVGYFANRLLDLLTE